MNEHEPTYEAPEALGTEAPDWRRLEVARGRFIDRVANGIAEALATHTEITLGTARCIAHVLGRAYGRQSHLADFGRTGEGTYLDLRDEYLALYANNRADPITKEWIDWLGTYLVQRENVGSGRRFMNEHLPPKLDQLLVSTSLPVGGERYLVNIPADWDSGKVDGVIELLTDLRLPEDEALQVFLGLPDVSVGCDNIMERFNEAFAGMYPDEEAALRALSPFGEWEQELVDWCIDHGIEAEALEWNLAPILLRLADLYDLVEREGALYAFAK
ncbi:hypothetical protein [Microbacterium capsulatum]|uniref:Uncharacterized protein n=1 Tax=Microbacterium capsulatum TaxID=3041921 RepID=A0ABU0XJ88_9MICO|nr:hypothetical protein [Microbacterium sp. ASV81]MDQ4213755.1 hypothetical protein [Microbacterium sp. ASV81]